MPKDVFLFRQLVYPGQTHLVLCATDGQEVLFVDRGLIYSADDGSRMSEAYLLEGSYWFVKHCNRRLDALDLLECIRVDGPGSEVEIITTSFLHGEAPDLQSILELCSTFAHVPRRLEELVLS